MTKQEMIYKNAQIELEKQIREVPGKGNNPHIIEYIKSIPEFEKNAAYWSDDSVAWCSCFVNWCVKKARVTPTWSAYARSWLKWGEVVKDPKEGDIVIFSRGKSKIYGHVAFFQKYTYMGTMVQCLGGNQDNALNVKSYPRWRVLGFRRAKDV